MSSPNQPDDSLRQVEASRFKRQLQYVLSLPERTVRSGTGLVAGALRESAALLVPQSFQNSQTYSVMVRQMLDFLTEDVGGVAKSAAQSEPDKVDNYLARKAVGNFLEMASLATFHLSPLTMLAVFSDVAYGSQTYLAELVVELKRQGVIADDSRIEHASDLLAAVATASKNTAQAFNTPPLSVEGLKQTIDETRAAVSNMHPEQLLPDTEIRQMWEQMRELAQRDGVDLLALSGAVTMQSLGTLGTLSRGALSGVRVTGALADRHIVQHYAQAIGRIREQGLYRSVSETSEPYLAAVWENFSADKTTLTEGLISGKLAGNAWGAVQRWLGRVRPTTDDTPPPDEALLAGETPSEGDTPKIES